jgi:hypothetical protein
MRTIQWFLLAALFLIMNNVFISLDISHGYMPTYDITGDPCLEFDYDTGGLGLLDLDCALRGNVYSPFIWFTLFLSFACTIMGLSNLFLSWWDKRKKK